MTNQYPYSPDPRFAAPPAPDYLSTSNGYSQNPYQYQQQQQHPFAPSPNHGSYQQFAPPPAPSYINGAQPPPQPYTSSAVPQIQYSQQQQQHQQPQYQAYSPQVHPPPPASPQPYAHYPSTQPNPSPGPQHHVNNAPPQPTLSPGVQQYANQPPLQPSHSPTPLSQVYPDPPAVQHPVGPPEKLSLSLTFVSEDKGSMRNKYRHTYTWAVSQGYTLVFDAPSHLSSSMASLTVNRGGKQVGHCNFFKSTGWNLCHIDFPFQSWPTSWNPDDSAWQSDCGTLNGDGMEWETATNDNGEVVFRCVAVGEDEQGNKSGVKGREICKVIVSAEGHEGDVCAVVELDGAIFGRGMCKEEQLDEMVTIAMIMVTRLSNGWRTQDLAAAGGGHHVDKHTTANALKLMKNSVELANSIMTAAGGGGA